MEKYQKYIVGAFGLGILILFVIYFTHIIGWILIALLFATLGSPMVKFIRRMRIKKFVIPKWIAALVTLATMWFIIVLAFRLLIPLVVDQIGEFQAIDIETISELDIENQDK